MADPFPNPEPIPPEPLPGPEPLPTPEPEPIPAGVIPPAHGQALPPRPVVTLPLPAPEPIPGAPPRTVAIDFAGAGLVFQADAEIPGAGDLQDRARLAAHSAGARTWGDLGDAQVMERFMAAMGGAA